MSDIEFLTPAPKVVLRNWFQDSQKVVIASAKTCYSSRTRTADEVTEDDINNIGKSTYDGGHHTLWEHTVFRFDIDNISRRASYQLCDFPFYNASQQSQRYVELKQIKVHEPELSGYNKAGFEKGVRIAWDSYNKLNDILVNHFSEKYGGRFSEKELKKAIEVARYVVPTAACTSMSYSVNGITLHRLNKMRNLVDVPHEMGTIFNGMIGEVNRVEPSFLQNMEDPFPLEQTPEYRILSERGKNVSPDYAHHFDVQLGFRRAKLISWTPNAERIVADSIRASTGLDSNQISDSELLNKLLDPAENPYLTTTMNVMMHSPIGRSLHHVHYVFREALSHTADHQNIRHRTTPASRMMSNFCDTRKPDVVFPEVFQEVPEAKAIADECVEELWYIKNNLVDNGVPLEFAGYLYPNAHKVRIIESGDAIDYLHKFDSRLCNRAQEEIHQNSIEKLEQMMEVHPDLWKFVKPRCKVRERADKRPFCPEGELTCKLPPYSPKRYVPTNL